MFKKFFLTLLVFFCVVDLAGATCIKGLKIVDEWGFCLQDPFSVTVPENRGVRIRYDGFILQIDPLDIKETPDFSKLPRHFEAYHNINDPEQGGVISGVFTALKLNTEQLEKVKNEASKIFGNVGSYNTEKPSGLFKLHNKFYKGDIYGYEQASIENARLGIHNQGYIYAVPKITGRSFEILSSGDSAVTIKGENKEDLPLSIRVTAPKDGSVHFEHFETDFRMMNTHFKCTDAEVVFKFNSKPYGSSSKPKEDGKYDDK